MINMGASNICCCYFQSHFVFDKNQLDNYLQMLKSLLRNFQRDAKLMQTKNKALNKKNDTFSTQS